MYVTGQGSLRYRNATKSRTRVITVLKAKDYALTAGNLDDRCRLPRIQSRVNALHKSNGCYACLSQVAWVHTSDGKQQVNAGSIPAALTN